MAYLNTGFYLVYYRLCEIYIQEHPISVVRLFDR